MTGYTVSFLPGSSGRFIANILYSLLNNISLNVSWTKENSAHNNNVYRYNIDYNNIPKIQNESQNNHVRLFRYLHFLPSDFVPVLSTHSYPVTMDMDANPHINDIRMVVISLRPEDLVEVNVNHIIKNILPLVKNLKSNGFESLNDSDKHYMYQLIKSLSEMKINFLNLDRPKYIFEYAEKASKKQQTEVFQRFINPAIDSRYIDKTLLLSYHTLFEYTDRYVGLDTLIQWTNTQCSTSLLETYGKYVSGRNELLEKLNKGEV